MQREERRVGFFGLRLELAAVDVGLSSMYIALKVGCSYENIRKYFRFEALPSRWLLKDLCRLLHMDRAEAQRLVALDYCRWKYGSAFWASQGLRPENDEFYVLWYFLTADEREMFLHQIQWQVESRKGQRTD